VTQTDGMRQQMLELHNKVRKEHNQHPLAFHPKLQKVAQEHAAHMQKRDELTHLPDLGERIKKAGYKFTNCAENVAFDTKEGSVETTFKGQWMKSSGHKANILNPDVSEVGIGRVFGPSGEYHCVVFAKPQG
jgi:serralysin